MIRDPQIAESAPDCRIRPSRKKPLRYQNLDQMKFCDENLDPGWNEFRPGQNFGTEDENLVLDMPNESDGSSGIDLPCWFE